MVWLSPLLSGHGRPYPKLGVSTISRFVDHYILGLNVAMTQLLAIHAVACIGNQQSVEFGVIFWNAATPFSIVLFTMNAIKQFDSFNGPP
jgi:hypothetical protein